MKNIIVLSSALNGELLYISLYSKLVSKFKRDQLWKVAITISLILFWLPISHRDWPTYPEGNKTHLSLVIFSPDLHFVMKVDIAIYCCFFFPVGLTCQHSTIRLPSNIRILENDSGWFLFCLLSCMHF